MPDLNTDITTQPHNHEYSESSSTKIISLQLDELIVSVGGGRVQNAVRTFKLVKCYSVLTATTLWHALAYHSLPHESLETLRHG